MRVKPQKVHIVHGDDTAKARLKMLLEEMYPEMKVIIPSE